MIVLQGTPERVEVLAFSPDGRRVVAPSYQGLQLWDINAGNTPKVFSPRSVRSVRFTQDGRKLLLGLHGFFVLDIQTGFVDSVTLELETPVQFDLTPDGQAVIFAQTDTRQPHPGRIYRRSLSDLSKSEWSISSRYRIWVPPLYLADHERLLTFESLVEMTPFRVSNVFVTRKVRTGETVAELVHEARLAFESHVASADRRLVAARKTKFIGIYHTDDLNLPPTILANDNRKEFTGLAFHPSGSFLAATSNDATVKFYDTTTWEMVHAFDWDIGRLRSIAFSPDGMLAAAGGDKGKIVVWDVDF